MTRISPGPLWEHVSHGSTYDPKQDERRLGLQQLAVMNLMADGAWRTLTEIAIATQHKEASVSARLRDLRKLGWTVEMRARNGVRGHNEYRATKEQAK